MHKKTAVIILISLFIIVFGWVYFQLSQIPVIIPPTLKIWWFYNPIMIDDAEMRTQVIVQISGTTYDAGTYSGTCFTRPSEEMWVGEISGVRCWWAGGGDDVWLFLEQGKIFLKQRVLDEWTAEEGGVIGEFQILRELSK